MPVITKELIEYLEGLYPDRCPRLSTPEREIWFQSGQADVVRHLREIHDEQNETLLGDQHDV